jgi:hypothetical protein
VTQAVLILLCLNQIHEANFAFLIVGFASSKRLSAGTFLVEINATAEANGQ